MTRPDDLTCAHEPFGDAYYYGPEHLGERFRTDQDARATSGFAQTTYKDVLDRLVGGDKVGDPCFGLYHTHEKLTLQRAFIKDMAYYLTAPNGEPTSVAPSLADRATDRDTATGNPTVLPLATLQDFHFAFLIRHPRRAIPSYYRCTVPPLVETTKFNEFLPSEAGFAELRRLFDYLRAQGLVGDHADEAKGVNGTDGTNAPSGVHGNGTSHPIRITVIDADDLLDRPGACIEAFCRAVDLDFRPEMLQWDDDSCQKQATQAFEKWAGFHNDALASTSLKPRTARHVRPAAFVSVCFCDTTNANRTIEDANCRGGGRRVDEKVRRKGPEDHPQLCRRQRGRLRVLEAVCPPVLITLWGVSIFFAGALNASLRWPRRELWCSASCMPG